MDAKEIKIKVKRNITLNTTDMLYQAVVTVYDKPKYYVYTLGNANSSGMSYYMLPTINVAVFSNEQDTDLYHDAIESIMEYQRTQKFFNVIKEFNAEETAKFYNTILPMKMGIVQEKTLEKQK